MGNLIRRCLCLLGVSSTIAQDARPLDIQLGCSAVSTYKPPAYGDTHKWIIKDEEAEFLQLKFDKFRLPATNFLTSRDLNSDEVEYIYENQTSGEFISKAIDSRTEHRYEIYAKQAICSRDNSVEAQCHSQAARKQYNLAKALIRHTIYSILWFLLLYGMLSLVCYEGHNIKKENCIGSQYYANNIRIEAMAERSCRKNCKRADACRGRSIATSVRLIAVSKLYDYAIKVYVPQHSSTAFVTEDRRSIFFNSITKLGAMFADPHGMNSGTWPIRGADLLHYRSDDLVGGIHRCGGCPNVAVRSERIGRDLQSKRQFPRCSAACTRETSSIGLADTDPVDILDPGDEGDAN